MLYRFCILCLGMPLLFAGCSRFGTGDPPPMAATQRPAEAVAPAKPTDDAPLIAKRTMADDVRQLLKDAEAALADDRLTTPIHDNAFDRFQAVLLLRPDNEQAKSGLQQVFARYVSMVRGALARNQPGSARALMERARLVDRNHPMLAELTGQIEVAEERLAQATDETRVGEDKEILLNVTNLDRRDGAVVEKLQELAIQVKETDEILLIVARSDAEGRWIYQRMSEGVPDYRLRGDIQLGRVPKILLLPPIEEKL